MKLLLALSIAAVLLPRVATAQMDGHTMPDSPMQVQPGEQKPAMPFGRTADEQQHPASAVPAVPSPVHLDGAVQEQEHPEQRTGSPETSVPDLLADAKRNPAQTLAFFQSKAAAANPTLRQAEAQVNRLRAEAKQQGLWQNPEIGYEADHIRGGSYAGGEEGGYVQQTIPLAGQRAVARAAVDAQRKQAELVLQQQRERVVAGVDRAFYAALSAQHEADLRAQLSELASDAAVNAHQLANIGQADAPDVLQAEVEREQARLILATAQREYRKAFAELAALSGDSAIPLGPLTGDLAAVPILASGAADAAAENNPTLEVARQQVAADDAAIRSARRQVLPQITLRAGLQQDNEPLESGGRVGVVGVAQAGVNLPLWNRNEGAVKAAAAERASSLAEVDRTRLALHLRGVQAAEDYSNAMEMVRRYREEMLPRAERSAVLYQQKYASMAAGYPQVLLSQKTLLELRVEYVHALRDAWQNAILLQHGLLQDGLMRPEYVGSSITAASGDAMR